MMRISVFCLHFCYKDVRRRLKRRLDAHFAIFLLIRVLCPKMFMKGGLYHRGEDEIPICYHTCYVLCCSSSSPLRREGQRIVTLVATKIREHLNISCLGLV